MEDEVLKAELESFTMGKRDILKMAAKLKTYRELLLMCYVNEVWKKGLTPIENLSPEMKNDIWQETKKETEGLGKKECVELAKITYLISSKL